MNVFAHLIRRIRMLFASKKTDVGKIFGVKLINSDAMNESLKEWNNIVSGNPIWADGNDVKTVNMAKHICDTRAKLTTLDIGIAISGSPRADYLQAIADKLLKRLPDQVATAEPMGGMIIKWNGSSWDFILPGDFGITKKDDDGNITGAIFASFTVQNGVGYTRLEYHRFDGVTESKKKIYKVTNRAFRNQGEVNGEVILGAEVPLDKVDEWAYIEPEVSIEGLEAPLFAHFRIPGSNTKDSESPLGLSAFANAITELEAIDVAISRKNDEVEDSRHITFVGQTLIKFADGHGIKLPRFVQGLSMGVSDSEKSAIHEHTPTLLTEERIKDINFNLSLAGVKCGFSEGVFVMDGQTGMITATQVESDDRDTIQTIKSDRDALKDAISQAISGADVMATLYGQSPNGEYEIAFNFGDITYNYEEDKAAWQGYVSRGWAPKWLYFVKFEGMSEEDAKAMVAEAEQANQEKAGLFGAE